MKQVDRQQEVYKIPLILTPQAEGGYTVTSPLLPELITEGATVEEVMGHVQDALRATLELYEDLKKPLPLNLRQNPISEPIWFEYLTPSR